MDLSKNTTTTRAPSGANKNTLIIMSRIVMTLMEGDISVMSLIGDTSELSSHNIIDSHKHCCVTGGMFILLHEGNF